MKKAIIFLAFPTLFSFLWPLMASAQEVSSELAKEMNEQIILLEQNLQELTETVEKISLENKRLTEKVEIIILDSDVRLEKISLQIKQANRAEKTSQSNKKAGHKSSSEQYQEILTLLETHQFSAAEKKLRLFVKNNSKDPLIGHAYYWLGESFYFRNQYAKASQAFIQGFKKYPQSPKAPVSLLKMGMSLSRLEKNKAACASFFELRKKYPEADSRILSLNEKEIEQNLCENKKEG